jgi:mono/diheme cytochrome c family protein
MKSLFKYYGIIYLLVLALIISLGMMYLNKLGLITTAKITPKSIIPDTTKPVVDLTLIKGSITPPIDVFKESISSPEKISKGKSLFETNCVSCHGTEGKGDGVAGKTLNPPPRNFTVLTGWKNGSKISQIFKTLQEGISASGMPQFNTIPVEDRFLLIHYVRAFNPDYPKDSPEDLKALDVQYSLTAGIKQPNRIPVSTAMKLLLNENIPKLEKIKNIVSKIENNQTDKGAVIFRKTTFDLYRAVTSLISYPGWNENELQFVNYIGISPDQKGFHASSVSLPKEEITLVFQYLKSLF